MAKIGNIVDGKYEILKEVGRGGMSIVYLAMDNRLNKQWAIKEIKKKGTNSENQIVMQSLISEANLMKRLDHQNLPRIVDIIDNGSTIYIVMDYIEGEPLDKILKRKGAQPQDAVIQWGIQLAEVLDYLHTRQPAIIYRDMKPANVMLKPDGSIKLYDFGIAREYKEQNSSDTVSLGTKGYAAPEQFGGMGQTDARTDVYGLGVTLYHLVTGKNPCEPPYEILPIRNVNPQLSSGLEAVIQKCTQLNPDDRFQSCAEVLYALNHLDEFDGRYRKAQKKKLNTFIVSVACTLALALAGTGTFIGYKMTLSQSVNETIVMYGKDAIDGGNITELANTMDKYSSEISEEKLNELFTNYMDVFENQIGQLAGEFNTASATTEMTEEVKKEYGDRETELFNGIDKIVEDHLKELSAQNQNEIYFRVGSIYMDYYKLCEGRFDRTYIKNRYEEAANRYKHITKDYDKESYEYIQKVCKIGDVISQFNNERLGLSDNGASLTNEDKTEAWNNMVECIRGEDRDNRKVNMYLIVGNIVFEHISEYDAIAETREEIASFSAEAAAYLNNYIAEHPSQEDENIRIKASASVTNYSDIYEYITKTRLEGTTDEQ